MRKFSLRLSDHRIDRFEERTPGKVDVAIRLVAAPTLVEASAVLLARKGPSGEVALDALLQRLSLVTIAMSPEAPACGREAFRRFGKGVGSPRVLNYGDCLAYGVDAHGVTPASGVSRRAPDLTHRKRASRHITTLIHRWSVAAASKLHHVLFRPTSYRTRTVPKPSQVRVSMSRSATAG